MRTRCAGGAGRWRISTASAHRTTRSPAPAPPGSRPTTPSWWCGGCAASAPPDHSLTRGSSRGLKQFSDPHLAALSTMAIGIAASVWGARRHPGPWMKWFSVAVAGLIFAGWAGEYVADVILGTWSVKYTLPAPAHRRGLGGDDRGAADAPTDARRARLLLVLHRVAAGGPHPGPRPELPERLLLHVLHLPRGRDRRRQLPGVRMPALPAPGSRLEGVRDHAGVGGDRRRRRPDHRRQLHVPAEQAGAPLAAEPDGTVAVVRRRRSGARARAAAAWWPA